MSYAKPFKMNMNIGYWGKWPVCLHPQTTVSQVQNHHCGQ